MDVKFDEEAIKLITLFESFTGSLIKDCIIDEGGNTIYMIVEEGKLGIAIGKNGKNIKTVEKIVKKNIKLFEFSPDITVFTRGVIPQANRIDLMGDKLEVWVDKKHRGIVIGRERKNLNLLKKIFKRNFGIKDLVIR
ncbi:MAG: NusA-like transcription termination signal-binding factor [Candidatus Aenigmarchaeota archaeon]|nr:NusA-like transcription termination signal-binding factor [Candidatus Aenigmarchaeota archaeon]